jgi:hypothetical protein
MGAHDERTAVTADGGYSGWLLQRMVVTTDGGYNGFLL